MKNIVASTVVRREFKQELIMKTKKAMALSKWDSNIKGDKILIKVDCSSEEVIPNTGVSPWVLEGVIKEIQDKIPSAEILLAEKTEDLKEKLKKWGLLEICKDNNVKIVNLTKEKHKESEGFSIPKIMFDVDFTISIFAPRIEPSGDYFGSVQNMTKCAANLDSKDATKLMSIINPNLSIADMTTIMRKRGFRKYEFKKLDRIIAGKDSIAVDVVCSKGFGIKPKSIPSIKNGISENIGKYPGKVIGEAPKTMIVYKNNLPAFLEKISFRLWKNIELEKELKRFLIKNPLYDQEFSKLI